MADQRFVREPSDCGLQEFIFNRTQKVRTALQSFANPAIQAGIKFEVRQPELDIEGWLNINHMRVEALDTGTGF